MISQNPPGTRDKIPGRLGEKKDMITALILAVGNMIIQVLSDREALSLPRSCRRMARVAYLVQWTNVYDT